MFWISFALYIFSLCDWSQWQLPRHRIGCLHERTCDISPNVISHGSFSRHYFNDFMSPCGSINIGTLNPVCEKGKPTKKEKHQNYIVITEDSNQSVAFCPSCKAGVISTISDQQVPYIVVADLDALGGLCITQSECLEIIIKASTQSVITVSA